MLLIFKDTYFEEYLQTVASEFMIDALFISNTFRDRTLSMYEGVRRVFVGVMKYFSHILMDHELFSHVLFS